MTAHTPLEQALAAWERERDPENRQAQVDDAVSLGETGVFSNFAISLITGLDKEFVGELTKKTDKTGGRFNPETLALIYKVAVQWRTTDACDHGAVREIVTAGTNPIMLSRLTGISRSAIYLWLGES
jgi:hypothetical protein